MIKGLKIALAVAALSVLGTGKALAWHLDGHIHCDTTGLPLAGAVVTVQGATGTGSFSGSAVTDAFGAYFVALPDVPGSFAASVDLAGLGGGTVVLPGPSVTFDTYTEAFATIDWLVSTPGCQQLGCWLTGGGAKFSNITGTYLAEHGPQQNFGGNVYPSCSPTPGSGGQWNHVDHGARLHFQGTAITVDRCGNVDGIPPGSTSPVTPYNFIEFHGTGTLKGIKGNKVDYGTVCFTARAEDRNEPGSNETRQGALTDRYFLRVTNCAGTTLLVLEDVAAPGTPVTITDGNLQIHVSSCSQ
jgi:hypothetical protein